LFFKKILESENIAFAVFGHCFPNLALKLWAWQWHSNLAFTWM